MAEVKQTMVPFLAGLLLAGTSTFVMNEMRKRGIEDLIPSHGNLLVHLFGGNARVIFAEIPIRRMRACCVCV